MKRLLALLICAVMMTAYLPLFGVEADAATAGGRIPLRYTALGDASTMGYGMSTAAGYNKVTAGTYPALVCDAFKAKGYDVTVDQLGMKGMRVEELRFLLDDSYQGDGLLAAQFGDGAAFRSKYAQKFRNSIAGANLITFNLGAVNFGSALISMATNTAMCTDQYIQELAAADDENIRQEITNAAGVDMQSAAGEYIDAAVYAYYSFRTGYQESIRLIREINPDACIVVVGIDNMLDGLSASIKINILGITINMNLAAGDLYNSIFISKANANMQKSADDNVVDAFVDASGFERFIDEARSYKPAYDAKKVKVSKQFKDFCDTYEDDFRIKSEFEKLYPGVRNQDKTDGLNTAYDVCAACIRDVANLQNIVIDNDVAAIIFGDQSVKEQLDGIGKELMQGIREESLIRAGNATMGIYKYDGVDNSFIKKAGDDGLYGANSTAGKIIMAIGIRAEMGNGFFMQPSANGHKTLANLIVSSCNGKVARYKASEVTCLKDGNKECWMDLGNMICYSDAGCTKSESLSSMFIKAYGHSYGPVKVVTKPAYCKDGKNTQTCTRCGDVKTITVNGLGPAGVKLGKMTGAKKSFTAKWKKPKNVKKISGYQLRYSLKASMKGAKTVPVGKKKTEKKISKLKSKKIYYVQIRTYATKNGKTYYSDWSKAKKVKTK